MSDRQSINNPKPAPVENADSRVDHRLKYLQSEGAGAAHRNAKEASPYQVILDTHILKPGPSQGRPHDSGAFPHLSAELKRVFYTLVEVFGYPVPGTTPDAAYRTIAYQHHLEYVRNPIPFVACPERVVQVHYIKTDVSNARGRH